MTLYAGGLNNFYQLGTNNGSLSTDYKKVVDSMTAVQFDLQGIQCISGGVRHSVIIKSGSVFAAGDDREFIIGGDSRVIYQTFTKINISPYVIAWAACGWDFTLYLTINGKVILCSKKAKGSRINIQLARRAVSVFAGRAYGCIIDDEGQINVLDRDDPLKEPTRFWLGSPAIDVACCDDFICVLAVDGRVFMINNQDSITEVRSLSGIRIEKLSGNTDVCAALSSDGRVFFCGKRKYYFFYNMFYDPFAEVKTKDSTSFKDVSCSDHILLLANYGKLLGIGSNEYCQLFQNERKEFEYWTPITSSKFFFGMLPIPMDHVIACGSHSFVLSMSGKIENPAKIRFRNQPIHSIPGALNREPRKTNNETYVQKPSSYLNMVHEEKKLRGEKISEEAHVDKNPTNIKTCEEKVKILEETKQPIEKISEEPRDELKPIRPVIINNNELIEAINIQNKEINYLSSLCRRQSAGIDKLAQICGSLMRQSEADRATFIQTMQKFGSELDAVKRENQGLREEMKIIRQDTQEIRKDTSLMMQETQKMKQQVNGMKEEMKQIRQDVIGIKVEKHTKKQETTQIRQDIQGIKDETIEMKQEIVKTRQESEQTRQAVQEMKQNTETIRQKFNETDQKTTNIQLGIAKSNQEAEQIKRKITGVEQEMQGIKRTTQGVKNEIQGIRQNTQNLRQDIQGIKQNIHGSDLKFVILKDEINESLSEISKKIDQEEVW